MPARFATLDIFVANHLPPFKLYVGVVNKLNPVMPPRNLLAALTPLNIAPPGAPNSTAIAPTSPRKVSGSVNLPSLTDLS